MTHKADRSAADLVAGIAGGLASEVICHAVNDHRSSHDIIQRKSFVIEDLIGVALIAHQRRQISGVLRMGHIGWIIVFSGLIKWSGTVAVFMNMHGVEVAGTLDGDIGKSEDLCFDQYSAIGSLIEFDRACQLGLGHIALHPGDGIGLSLVQQIMKGVGWCWLIHGYTSFFVFLLVYAGREYRVHGFSGVHKNARRQDAVHWRKTLIYFKMQTNKI